MSTSPCSTVDADIIASWQTFLRTYAAGEGLSVNGAPCKPPLLPGVVTDEVLPPDLHLDVPLYPEDEDSITPETARGIAKFYSENHFLPAPRRVNSDLRDRLVMEYDIFKPEQLRNFDRFTRLARSIMGGRIATVSIFSPFKQNTQVVMAVAGDIPVVVGQELTPETTICAHISLRITAGIVQLHSTRDDWRFERNPWVLLGVNSYIVDPMDPSNEQSIPIGVLNIVDSEPIPPLSNDQRDDLQTLVEMLSFQICATWEGYNRRKDPQLRAAVSTFLEHALVREPAVSDTTSMDSYDSSSSGSKVSSPRSNGLADPSPFGDAKLEPTVLCTASSAVHQIRHVLELDLAVIVELSSFRTAPVGQGDIRNLSFDWLEDPSSPLYSTARVIASSSSEHKFQDHWDSAFQGARAMPALSSFLSHHSSTSQVTFDSFNLRTSGLESLLPRQNMSHIAIPFFIANQPTFLVVVASAAPFCTFSPSDVLFVENMGVVLVATEMRERIVEASAAKTSFVSRISHELLTPLHGIMGQISMVRDAIEIGDLTEVTRLLGFVLFSLRHSWASRLFRTAEYCGTTLKEIIKNMLDFGQQTSATRGVPSRPGSPLPAVSGIDLIRLTSKTLHRCWEKRQAAGDAMPVDLIFTHTNLSSLPILLDGNGYSKILENLVDNALKFTRCGKVDVELRVTMKCGRREKEHYALELTVKDTGVGMSSSFVDAGVFQAFRQGCAFSGGTGLGLFLTKSIVDKLGGEIGVHSTEGVGTTVLVSVPVNFANDLDIVTRNSKSGVIQQWIARPPCAPTVMVPDCPAVPVAPNNPPATAVVTEHIACFDIIARKLLFATAQKLNAIAQQASDGDEAVELYKTFKPHIVWTDVSMPRMDGVTASKHIRRFEQEAGCGPAYIVAISAIASVDECLGKEALLGEAAVDEWMVKGQSNRQVLREGFLKVQSRLLSPMQQIES
ncbi:hypothetical protein DL96DRAFT_1820122 [Flagelloscypha sp. PMI_526]|nr:hypothetical protein DL96DRAFT_1820122 [Flagelloscypha sp. PMI_526]